MNKIDRSNIDFTSEPDICNIGYFETIIDDYPIRIERFTINNVDTITVFIDEENMNIDKLKNILTDNKIVEFIKDNSLSDKYTDLNDNTFITLNIPLRNGNDVYNNLLIDLKSYDF